MNDKVVTQPVAKRLKEAGWVKPAELHWSYFSGYNIWQLESFFRTRKLREKEYFAPDLLDITREIRKFPLDEFGQFVGTIVNRVSSFINIFCSSNEVNCAAEIWLSMKKEGL